MSRTQHLSDQLGLSLGTESEQTRKKRLLRGQGLRVPKDVAAVNTADAIVETMQGMFIRATHPL